MAFFVKYGNDQEATFNSDCRVANLLEVMRQTIGKKLPSQYMEASQNLARIDLAEESSGVLVGLSLLPPNNGNYPAEILAELCPEVNASLEKPEESSSTSNLTLAVHSEQPVSGTEVNTSNDELAETASAEDLDPLNNSSSAISSQADSAIDFITPMGNYVLVSGNKALNQFTPLMKFSKQQFVVKFGKKKTPINAISRTPGGKR